MTRTQTAIASGDMRHNAEIALPLGSRSAVRVQMLELDYREALQGCLEGRFTEELRVLYQMPSREHVPWQLFPDWRVPLIPSRVDTKEVAFRPMNHATAIDERAPK